MGEGNTMISALWGVFVWKEFRGADSRVRLDCLRAHVPLLPAWADLDRALPCHPVK